MQDNKTKTATIIYCRRWKQMSGTSERPCSVCLFLKLQDSWCVRCSASKIYDKTGFTTKTARNDSDIWMHNFNALMLQKDEEEYKRALNIEYCSAI